MDEKRAFTYGQAIEMGLEPKEYIREVPKGEYILKLKFKIWGSNCLHCYFIDPKNENKKFILTAYSAKGYEYQYLPRDKKIDFSAKGSEENLFNVTVGTTKNGYSSWLTADQYSSIGL
jgi:hypothetical protein